MNLADEWKGQTGSEEAGRGAVRGCRSASSWEDWASRGSFEADSRWVVLSGSGLNRSRKLFRWNLFTSRRAGGERKNVFSGG